MFPDSKIAKEFTCGETKTAAVTGCFGKYYESQVLQEGKTNPFTLMIDESNDSSDKVRKKED